jgi:hypothetical protein
VASSAAQRDGKEFDALDENRDFPALWARRFLAAVKNGARPAFNLMKMSRVFIHTCVRGANDDFAMKRMLRAPADARLRQGGRGAAESDGTEIDRGRRLDPEVIRCVSGEGPA